MLGRASREIEKMAERHKEKMEQRHEEETEAYLQGAKVMTVQCEITLYHDNGDLRPDIANIRSVPEVQAVPRSVSPGLG
jgi:hypothetical protein